MFIPNLGQVSPDVYFQLIGPTPEAHFRARSIGIRRRVGIAPEAGHESLVDVRFVGANPRPEVRATGLADRDSPMSATFWASPLPHRFRSSRS